MSNHIPQKSNQPEAIIFIGLQASGKSSFYQRYFFQSHMRISRDLFNTRHREQVMLQACLDTEMSFVVDNTNPTQQDRARYLEALQPLSQYRKIGYFFQSKIDDCMRRNQAREGKACIPDQGLLHTHRLLQMPALDEGFDELYFVALDEQKAFHISPWQT